MNWLSAVDVIPLAVIVLCAIGELSQITARRRPLIAILPVVIAIGAFHMLATKIHGAPTAWWELLIDAVLAVLFVSSIATSDDLPQRNRPTRHSPPSPNQG